MSNTNVIETKKRKAFDKVLKEIEDHFKDGPNYSLDIFYFKEDVIYNILGDLGGDLNNFLKSKGFNVTLHFEDNKLLWLISKGEYIPIYYNEEKNKLVTVENTRNKSYIFKYSESNGWTEIGVL